MALDNDQVRERVARIDALLEALESLPEGMPRSTALDAVQNLLDLYGEALTRVVNCVRQHGNGALAALVDDELIAHLLMVHDLHPADLGTRVARALDEVRPYLRSHGGDVELVGINGDVALLRLIGSCAGCPSSTATLRHLVEDAIRKAAPDLARIETNNTAEVHA